MKVESELLLMTTLTYTFDGETYIPQNDALYRLTDEQYTAEEIHNRHPDSFTRTNVSPYYYHEDFGVCHVTTNSYGGDVLDSVVALPMGSEESITFNPDDFPVVTSVKKAIPDQAVPCPECDDGILGTEENPDEWLCDLCLYQPSSEEITAIQQEL